MEELKVVIVDDDPLLLELVGGNLSAHKDVEVVATATDGLSGIEAVQELDGKVDILVLDAAMPGISGSETARLARLRFPELKILIFTAFERESMLSEALRAGANGFLTKDLPPDELVEMFRRVMGGETVLTQRPLSLLTGAYLKDGTLADGDEDFEVAWKQLPPRLQEVVQAIGRASTNDQIARTFGLSEGTVRGYVSEVLQRTGCRSRTEVAVRTVRLGLTD